MENLKTRSNLEHSSSLRSLESLVDFSLFDLVLQVRAFGFIQFDSFSQTGLRCLPRSLRLGETARQICIKSLLSCTNRTSHQDQRSSPCTVDLFRLRVLLARELQITLSRTAHRR